MIQSMKFTKPNTQSESDTKKHDCPVSGCTFNCEAACLSYHLQKIHFNDLALTCEFLLTCESDEPSEKDDRLYQCPYPGCKESNYAPWHTILHSVEKHDIRFADLLKEKLQEEISDIAQPATTNPIHYSVNPHQKPANKPTVPTIIQTSIFKKKSKKAIYNDPKQIFMDPIRGKPMQPIATPEGLYKIADEKKQ